MNTIEFTIPFHYVPTLIYGDSTNLSDEEEATIDCFCAEILLEYGLGYWTFDIDNIEPYFSQTNDVESLSSDVVTMKYIPQSYD